MVFGGVGRESAAEVGFQYVYNAKEMAKRGAYWSGFGRVRLRGLVMLPPVPGSSILIGGAGGAAEETTVHEERRRVKRKKKSGGLIAEEISSEVCKKRSGNRSY